MELALNEFAKSIHNRFFDVGIAEEHATTLAAGMASAGLKTGICSIFNIFTKSF